MFSNFTEEARNIIVCAKKEMNDLKHPYIGSEHLLLAILKDDNEVSKILKKYKLDYKKFKDEILNIIGVGTKESNYFLYTPLLKRIFETAIIDCKESNQDVKIENLFSALLEEGEGVAIRILLSMNIDIEKIYKEFSYSIFKPIKRKKTKKLLLDEIGIDLTKKALNNELDPVIGREEEIKRMLEILSRRCKNNPILIGEAGVGKTALVEELSRKIIEGDVPISLLNKRIISLDMATAVAGTKYRGEFEERMNKIIKEIEENDDIILFIDEVHTLVNAGGAEGAIDASNIFKPALARGKLRCIGATTIEEYKKYIEKDSALSRRFQKIDVNIPDKEKTKNILINLKKIYEKYHKVIIDDKIIDLIIELSDKYIYDRFEPDKSIDILDEVCASVSIRKTKEKIKYLELKKEYKNINDKKNNYIIDGNYIEASNYKEKENKIIDEINNLELKLYLNNKKIVTKEDVANVINIKTKIPVFEILNEEKTLEKIEKNLKNSIIGQDKAINEILKNIKKIKLGYKEKNKCYSFLFVGSSGVGKTELSRIFGDNLVGRENVIKLDMSEFSEAFSVSKIIGAPPGYVGYLDNKNILEEIKNKPYSLLILDEIEKAHPRVLNLLFQILEDGKIKDSAGRTVRFDNVTIVMTSNIGFNDIYVGFNKKNNNIILSKLKESFDVALINRIDSIVIFNELDEKNIKYLINNKLNKLKEKYNDLNILINNKVVREIIELSCYREFGARKIDKIIKNQIESIIIDSIIDNKDVIKIDSIKEIVK